MKRSNIIIIAFFIFVLSGMLALFIFTKNYEKTPDKKIKTEVIDLPHFTVIVAEPESKFKIISGDSNKIIIVDLIKSEKKPLPFVIKNDTLKISEKYAKENSHKSLLIKCTDVKTIIARNTSEINIDNFDSDSLTVLADKGIILFGYDDDGYDNPTKSNINKFTFIAKNNSKLTIHEMNIDNAIIRMKNSRTEIMSANKIKKISAVISDSSRFVKTDRDCNEMEIELKSDKSSKITFFNLY